MTARVYVNLLEGILKFRYIWTINKVLVLAGPALTTSSVQIRCMKFHIQGLDLVCSQSHIA